MRDISNIVALSLNGIIGDSEANNIPWYLPNDLKYFKSVTFNKSVVMGSRTFESIGKPLKDRRNVVITRNPIFAESLKLDGVDETYSSFTEVIKQERDGFMVIGGAHIYGEALKYQPSKMFITVVKQNPEGDVRFPISGERFLRDIVILADEAQYQCVKRSGWLQENGIEYQFTEFQRDAYRPYH